MNERQRIFEKIHNKLGGVVPSRVQYIMLPDATTLEKISNMIVGLTGKTVDELGYMGTKMIFDNKTKEKDIISFFREDAIKQVEVFAGKHRVSFPAINELEGYFFNGSPQMVDSGKKGVIGFRWHTNMFVCAVLNISILTPHLNYDYIGVELNSKKKKDPTKSTALVVKVNMPYSDGVQPYKADEIPSWFEMKKSEKKDR